MGEGEVLVVELVAVDGLAASAVVVGEVTALAHELGDDAVEGAGGRRGEVRRGVENGKTEHAETNAQRPKGREYRCLLLILAPLRSTRPRTSTTSHIHIHIHALYIHTSHASPSLVPEARLSSAKLPEVLRGLGSDVSPELESDAADVLPSDLHVEEDLGVRHGEAGTAERPERSGTGETGESRATADGREEHDESEDLGARRNTKHQTICTAEHRIERIEGASKDGANGLAGEVNYGKM